MFHAALVACGTTSPPGPSSERRDRLARRAHTHDETMRLRRPVARREIERRHPDRPGLEPAAEIDQPVYLAIARGAPGERRPAVEIGGWDRPREIGVPHPVRELHEHGPGPARGDRHELPGERGGRDPGEIRVSLGRARVAPHDRIGDGSPPRALDDLLILRSIRIRHRSSSLLSSVPRRASTRRRPTLRRPTRSRAGRGKRAGRLSTSRG